MDDLADLRKSIAEIITESENVPVMAENFMEINKTPKEAIESKVDECDCYIGIFDKQWGFIPTKNNPSKLSVTAIEYERARRNRISKLILISKKEKDKELEDFIKKISDYETRNWRNKYSNDSELQRFVTRGIPKLISAITDVNFIHRNKFPEYISISVSPSITTYEDEIEDVSADDINFISNNILNSKNPNIISSAWRDLEIFTRNKRIWKYDNVWKVIDKEIAGDAIGENANDAIFILKGMLRTSKRDNNNEVVYTIKQKYSEILEKILINNNAALDKSRPDIKQIFDEIYKDEEKFFVLWNILKHFIIIENDEKYIQSISAIINDLEHANRKYKYAIKNEIYNLMDSSNSIIAKRAKNIHSFLFK